ncbi:MAG: AmmeMemoRadiSam system protein B [Candidatus Hydrogenedentes bacterium]|nr:AmmeMemoRadiSam system protein B [Candidatus Hydrogenedentota bacterium]
MPLPPLRYLDVFHTEFEGEAAVILSDTEGFIEQPLVLSPLAYYIAAQLDGENDISDIQYLFSVASGGREIRDEDIIRVVEILDDHGFLFSENYRSLREKVIAEFNALTVRSAHLAGKSYPDDATELREYLDAYYLCDAGPRQLPGAASIGQKHVPCFIVPHIDYERGGHSYAHGYLRAAASGRPETVIVFGVAHGGSPTPFVLTRKDFDTPLGRVCTDVDLVDEIATRCPWDVFTNEIAHRTEHSIEFQAVMIAHAFGADVRIVPILCGPFLTEENIIAPQVEEFLHACRTAVAGLGRRVTVLASADLAHVGLRFGDAADIDDAILDSVRMRDEEDLAPVLTGEAEAWYSSVMRDGNARRVCGINCIYAALRTAEGAVEDGQLLHYGYAPDPGGGIVTFASVVFPSKP